MLTIQAEIASLSVKLSSARATVVRATASDNSKVKKSECSDADCGGFADVKCSVQSRKHLRMLVLFNLMPSGQFAIHVSLARLTLQKTRCGG